MPEQNDLMKLLEDVMAENTSLRDENRELEALANMARLARGLKKANDTQRAKLQAVYKRLHQAKAAQLELQAKLDELRPPGEDAEVLQ